MSLNGRVVSGGGDGHVKLWDLQTGQLITSFLGHEQEVVSGASLTSMCSQLEREDCFFEDNYLWICTITLTFCVPSFF